MADLEIDVPTLKGKSSELSTLKSKATSAYDKCIGSYLCTVGDPISGLKEIVKAPMERFKNGYEQSDSWFSNYLNDLESVESGLESFKGTNVTAPTSFSGKFEDLFGKVTMPVLKTNGDKLANYKTFNSTTEETTEASTEANENTTSTSGNSNSNAVNWAVSIANNNSYGYSQATRWGNPNYDCSSLVISAWEKAGVPVKSKYGATSTRNMKKAFVNSGKFVWVPGQPKASDLRPGDVLWRKGHTEMYIGNNKRVGAHSNYDGKNGDSSGREVNVTKGVGNWAGYLKYVG